MNSLKLLARKARKKWQQTRFSLDKKHFNFLSKKLKTVQKSFQNRKLKSQLERLDPTKSTPSGKSQRKSYDQSAVNLQSETLIIHGPKPILKKQRLSQIIFTKYSLLTK